MQTNSLRIWGNPVPFYLVYFSLLFWAKTIYYWRYCMSYGSNTRVVLLNEQFAKLLLFAFSSGFSNGSPKLVNLLHNYRGVESEDRYNPVINKLVDAMYLSEASTTYYDGKKIVFGTLGWYKEVNFIFTPEMGKIEIVDSETEELLVSTKLPGVLEELCYMVKSLADEILGKSKDFKAVPSRDGHDLKRTYK